MNRLVFDPYFPTSSMKGCAVFEDRSRELVEVLSSLDVAAADAATVRGWLADVARLRSALDGFEARAAARLGEASVVRGASRCTQREADRAVARGQLIEAVPQVGEALASGAISGAHVDTLARAAEQTTTDAVAASSLLEVAKAKPADAMSKQVAEFVRRQGDDAALAARLERQRRNRRAVLFAKEMGVVHAEYDDTTYAEIRAAIDTETDRLYHLDGGREEATHVRTAQQRRADAIAGLLLQQREGITNQTDTSSSRGTPAVRNQMLIIAHTDGTGSIPGIGPLPRSEIERLTCISDLYGLVFDGNGQPLWHGPRVQLADDNQWRALIARDGGCIACAAHPSRCEAHHIVWRSHHGPTDIDNLALLCKHHHHLIHNHGWQLITSPDGQWTLMPP